MPKLVVITPGVVIDLREEMTHTSTMSVVHRIGRRLNTKELDQLNIWLQGLVDDELGLVEFKVRPLEFYDEDTMSSLFVEFKTPASTRMVKRTIHHTAAGSRVTPRGKVQWFC